MNFETLLNKPYWDGSSAIRAADLKVHAAPTADGFTKGVPVQTTQDMTDEEKTERHLEILDGLFDDANFESHYIPPINPKQHSKTKVHGSTIVAQDRPGSMNSGETAENL